MGSQRVGHDSATCTFKEAIVSLLFPGSWQLLFQKLLGTRARSEVSAPSIYVTVLSWDLSGGSSCSVNFASLSLSRASHQRPLLVSGQRTGASRPSAGLEPRVSPSGCVYSLALCFLAGWDLEKADALTGWRSTRG